MPAYILRRLRSCVLLLGAAGLVPGEAVADVYKKLGANGVPTYTNKYSKGATKVKATSYIYSYLPTYARVVPTGRKKEYAQIAERVAGKYGVDPDLVKAVIAVESGYDPNAISPKGAQGLMQLMPGTADRFDVTKPFDPEQNIEGGVKYLKFLDGMFGGNVIFMIASYNAGEGIVSRLKDVPPYSETQNYVRKVLALRDNRDPGPPGPSMLRKPLYSYTDENGLTLLTDEKPAPSLNARLVKP